MTENTDIMGLSTTSRFHEKSRKIRNRSAYLRTKSIKIRQIKEFLSIDPFWQFLKCVKIWTYTAKNNSGLPLLS